MVWTHTIQTDTGGMAGGMASDSHSICVQNRQAAATGVPAVLGRTDPPPPRARLTLEASQMAGPVSFTVVCSTQQTGDNCK
jgi:hypothetical protein